MRSKLFTTRIKAKEVCPEWDGTFLSSKRLVGLARKHATSYLPSPGDRISDLVIRKRKGEYVLAAFVFEIDNTTIETNRTKRPSAWVLFDFKDGHPLEYIPCRELEFSEAPYETGNRRRNPHTCYYNIGVDADIDVSTTYYESAYGILDEVRTSVIDGADLDIDLYYTYLDSVIKNTPQDFKRFFDDLSDPDGATE